MRIDVLTLFPAMFDALQHSIPAKAAKAGVFDLRLHHLRDFPLNRYGAVDDYPYGGEPGMVLHPQPLQQSLEKALEGRTKVPVIYPHPHGKPLTQADVREWAQVPEIILVCGHYKGIDERFRYLHVTHEFSVGDYVLSGGEMASLVFLDAIARLLPGVLGDEGSARTDSFEEPLLGWPVYTRPEVWNGLKVPEALLSGNHDRIRKWQRRQQLLWTMERRPDLWAAHHPTKEDRKLLENDIPF
ncbi:MAG TPA: tRNA (guanosine(37)-N1)-methyltransferase TrmD [Fibrobacteria bacterium]|nr:tRNA (guanosine(37)-N1)-methyltransferase TrmD [Fibrobacteria bacterium]HOX51516.1 tRNA (guanosine(37)-N1)-methyltransferase TrmD [Fibrobacteria bacterium]